MRKLFVAVGLFIAGLAGSVQAQFCPGVSPWVFDDVLASDPFCPNVTWMAVNGITTGCKMINALNRDYCPNDGVTRKSMAAFMNRLGTATTSTLSGNYFKQGGSAFGTTATLGTTDGQPLDVLVGNQRVMHYGPTVTSPNVIGGHSNNSADTFGGETIAGGGKAGTNCHDPSTDTYSRFCGNQALQGFATVGGGNANIASGSGATVGGGTSNTAGKLGFANFGATVGGGEGNTASGDLTTIGGGVGNTASGIGATVGGGTGNIAAGGDATVPGGFQNQALGAKSFAAGQNANAQHDNSFAWSGSAFTSVDTIAAGDFVVYAPYEVRLYAGPVGAGGCTLPNGTAGWVCASDRNLKENFTALDPRDILERLDAIPITRWTAKAIPGIWHVGPMAQDFYRAFRLGNDELAIGTTDAHGIAFAAIQGLNARVEEQQREIADLRERVSAAESLRGELAGLRAELAGLREARSQNTARAPAADGFRADAAR